MFAGHCYIAQIENSRVGRMPVLRFGSKTAALQVVWYHRCGTSCGLNAFRCFR